MKQKSINIIGVVVFIISLPFTWIAYKFIDAIHRDEKENPARMEVENAIQNAGKEIDYPDEPYFYNRYTLSTGLKRKINQN